MEQTGAQRPTSPQSGETSLGITLTSGVQLIALTNVKAILRINTSVVEWKIRPSRVLARGAENGVVVGDGGEPGSYRDW